MRPVAFRVGNFSKKASNQVMFLCHVAPMASSYSSASYASLLSGLASSARGAPEPAALYNLAQDVPHEPDVAFALSIPPFSNCVHWRATANAKLNYSSKDESINAILRRPNRWQSKYAFFYAIVRDLTTYGVSWVYIDRRSSGEPRGLFTFAPPELTQREQDREIWWEQRRWGTGEKLRDKDMIKIEQEPASDIHISNGLKSAWMLLTSYYDALRRINAVWHNGATASQYIALQQELTPEAMMEAKAWLKQANGRAGPNYGGPLVLQKGAELRRVELTGIDAWPAFLKEIVAEIAASQSVPYYVASGIAEQKYDNFIAMLELSHSDTILPMAKQISIEMSDSLGVDIEVNTNELLLGTPLKRNKLLMDCGYMTTNERREQAKRWGLFDPDLLERIDEPAMDLVTGVAPAREELEIQRDAARLLSRREGLIGEEDVRNVLEQVPGEPDDE